MNKKIITIVSSIIVLLLLAGGGYFFYHHSQNSTVKAEHDKYIALINDNHDFDGGLKGLESLDKDESTLKNIKTEIKIATELKNVDASLDNKDVDSAKKSMEKIETLTVDNTFDKAVNWLKDDITNYDKATEEMKNASGDDINSILEKYKFNHNALKAKLSEEKNNSSSGGDNSGENNAANTSQSTNTSSSIPDTANTPRLGMQQVPITYGELKRGMWSDGTTGTDIQYMVSTIEAELGGKLSNFTNEQISDAIGRINARESNNTRTGAAETGYDAAKKYYTQWASKLDSSMTVIDEGYRFIVVGDSIKGGQAVIVYDNPHLVRIVNAQTNVYVEF